MKEMCYLCTAFLRLLMLKVPGKKLYIQFVVAVVVVLFIVRLCNPMLTSQGHETSADVTQTDSTIAEVMSDTALLQTSVDSVTTIYDAPESAPLLSLSEVVPHLDFRGRHPIRSVVSYRNTFPDLQEIHYPAAMACGVTPVENRAEAEYRKKELLYVGANPYYMMDKAMNRSIPYLVPKASHLLQHIGRRFLDSLAVKGIPLHKIIVTSVLRTEDDVRRLRRINGNASEQSCHRFGTTFDISYNRYHTVAPPDSTRRAVRNDSLKFVLSEVLRDIRSEGLCYIKYEVKQGCFHITVR